MRVESVSVDLRKQQLVAIVTDDGGKVRQIEYVWFAAKPPVPPLPDWREALQGECEYQRAEALAAQKGRTIP